MYSKFSGLRTYSNLSIYLLSMYLIILIVGGLCAPAVISIAPFNFREKCNVIHLNSTLSVSCDGRNKRISTMYKDLVLDNRSTAIISSMNLENFENITLYSNVMVQTITISNTKNVSLYTSNTKLKKLVIESVDVLTLKHLNQDNAVTWTVAELAVHDVKSLKFVNDGGGHFILPVIKVNISKVNDFALESLILNVKSNDVSIMNTKIRFENQSSLLLDSVSTNITDTTIYIHDNGYFYVKVDNFSVVDSDIVVENGSIKLFNSKQVVFFRNDLFGFEDYSLSVGYSDVKFLNNNIFTKDIGNLLTFNREYLTFTDNMFGCWNKWMLDCDNKDKLLGVDFSEIGDENYCYTDCIVSLNTYKTLLKNACVCNNRTTIDNNLLCASSVLMNETCSTQTISVDVWPWQYILLVSIPVILTILILCYIWHKSKKKCVFFPQKLECKDHRDNSVFIYSNLNQNTVEDRNNIYENVIEPEIS